MLKIIITLCLIVCGFTPCLAQRNIWDGALTEINISHNEDNYNDHKGFRDNQIVSQASVNGWMKTKNEFKNLSDKINQRLTQAFIVEADIVTLYHIQQAFQQMYDYQSKSINIATNYPFAIPVVINKEEKIINDAYNLLLFVEAMIQTYGEVNKMKTSQRQIIYREISTQLQLLTGQCYSLYNTMKMIQSGSLFSNAKPVQYFNRDKQLTKDILKQLKF
jgi:hypothetical protein